MADYIGALVVVDACEEEGLVAVNLASPARATCIDEIAP